MSQAIPIQEQSSTILRCSLGCGTKTIVVDSRPIDGGSHIRRRRKCPTCGLLFTTYEIIATPAAFRSIQAPLDQDEARTALRAAFDALARLLNQKA